MLAEQGEEGVGQPILMAILWHLLATINFFGGVVGTIIHGFSQIAACLGQLERDG